MSLEYKAMFSAERVLDLAGGSKKAVIAELVDALATSPHVTDRKDLLEKMLEREKQHSTGVGLGLALPHVKIASVRDFVIGIGRHAKGVDFDSLDGKPAHIVIMIGCNVNQSADYMKILGRLVRALKEKDFQDRLMAAPSEQAVVDLFTGADGVFSS